jgi:replicative superfamily II helicase
MPQNYNNGRDNLEFYNRLGDNHKELALYFSIKLRTRELWKAGTEGEKIIEWLENINRLQELPEALTDIGRKDLVELATSLFRLEPSLSIADAEIPESELEKIDETDTLTYELPQENSFAELDGNNLDLVLSSDLDSSTPDLQSQESTSSEAEAEIADKPEEEEVNTPIEEMRETDDGQPTLFALWEIALKSDLKEEFVEDYEAEKFLKKMYHQSPQARSGLTQIQKKLWDACQNTEAEVLNQPFHSNLNVLISAPTSSGKSTIAEIFMAIPSLRYETRKCAIYIAPTRALTQAKYADLKNLFSEYEQYFGQIVLSTGEDITDDWRINSAQFSIACMVYEKANILFSQNPKLRKNLGCIVVDEMHMIADLSRGPILEMALTKALFEQTNNLSNEAMRIVLISTEGKPKRDIISFLSVRHDGVWKDLLPFCDDDREVSVEHILVLGTKEPAEQKLVLARKEEELTKKCFYKKILIAEFKNNEQRELSPKNIRDIQVNLDDFKHREEKDESDQKRNGEFNNRLIKLILDLLIEQPKGYRILVFVPSRKEAEHRASTLKDKLQDYWNRNDDEYGFLGSNERHKNLGEKFRELLKNAEDPRMAKTLEQCIKFGLFIHHSDIERKIRAEIEKTCSVISPDMPSQIIFATETLSYGINLAVQDVILCGVKFPNQNRFGELEDEPVFLSNSSYHNMIGRAGRKGKGDRGKAHAYILVPHKSKPIKIVSRYYKMIHSVESKLYCAEDKSIQDNAEFDRSFQNSYGLENGGAKYGASDFSYPFSRSILDALRHLNIGDNAEKQRKKIKIDGLMKLLNRTFYRRITQLSQADNKRENNLFLSAIQIILDDCSSNQLELVEKSSIEGENWYQITPLGESIIDTGTKISTVVELRKIVNAIHSLWDKSYGSHDRDFPMELYLLCVVAQKEVFRDYMRCTPECTKIDSRKWPKDSCQGKLFACRFTIKKVFNQASRNKEII